MNQVEQTIVPDNIINFGLGYPSPEMLPDKMISDGTYQYEVSPYRNQILQYGYVSGYLNFRKNLANFIDSMTGRTVDPENLFVTNGISGGLHLVASVFAKAGDTVFVEDTSYFIGIRIFQSLGLNVISVPTTKDGIDITQLQELLKKHKPKFLYIIPFNHNPRGFSMDPTTISELSLLSEEHGFHIVSDEVYELLHFEDEYPFGGFHKLGGPNLISLNTFSKILAPGLRLGWIQASKDVIKRLSEFPVIVSGGAVNPLVSLIVEPLLGGALQKHILGLRSLLRERKDCMISTIKKSFGTSVRFSEPNGGYFVWVEFPDNRITDPDFMNQLLVTHGIRYQPGYNFNLDKKFKNCARFSFSFYDKEKIITGILRLFATYSTSIMPVRSEPTRFQVYGSGRLGNEIIALSECPEAKLHKDLSNLQSTVVIDASSPEGTSRLINGLFGQPLIIGTTGEMPMDQIREYSKIAPVIMCSNFSRGIQKVKEICKLFDDWDVDIIEMHHSGKKDSPSGTAKDLARQFSTVSSITGLRAGSNFGEHMIIMHNGFEKVEIRHQALTRSIFAEGAVALVDEVRSKPAGLYVI